MYSTIQSVHAGLNHPPGPAQLRGPPTPTSPQSSGIAASNPSQASVFASRCLCESGPQKKKGKKGTRKPSFQGVGWRFGACHTKSSLLHTQRVRSCHLRNDSAPPSRYDVRSSICFTNIGRHPRLSSSPSQGSGEWRPLNRPTVLRADKTLVNPLFSSSSRHPRRLHRLHHLHRLSFPCSTDHRLSCRSRNTALPVCVFHSLTAAPSTS